MKKIILYFMFILLGIHFVSAQQVLPGCGMVYGLYGGYGAGIMVLSWLTYILLTALIIAAVYWLIKSADKKR